MQLNESTYETIFLLYIDKELSPKERLEVEAFIADNPNFALEMEALQATVLGSDKIHYPFKENLKQQVTSSLEDLEKEWNQTYTTILKADVDAIPSLSTSFKNTLKKDATKEGIVIKPFGFSQQKFTYAAVAACLMAFIGYQQLTKTPVSNSIAVNTTTLVVPNTNSTKTSDEIALSNASPKIFAKAETLAKTNQQVITKLQLSNSSKTQGIHLLQKESIAMAETAPTNNSINQTVITKLPSNYNNPITINAIPLPISSANIDAEPTEVEKILTSYEIIDTEDPDRTIFIANFEIDGNKFRGLTRRVSALLKRNKSEKEK
jgi:hypothetical protein